MSLLTASLFAKYTLLCRLIQTEDFDELFKRGTVPKIITPWTVVVAVKGGRGRLALLVLTVLVLSKPEDFGLAPLLPSSPILQGFNLGHLHFSHSSRAPFVFPKA